MVAEVRAPLLSPAKDGGEEKERVAMVGLGFGWRREALGGSRRNRGLVGWVALVWPFEWGAAYL